ncbi:MAG: ATP-binding protein [Fuerstiella sp.]
MSIVSDHCLQSHAAKVGSELLFDVISSAYERQSLIVTTNLPFENWTEVLSSERLTGATLDRLSIDSRSTHTPMPHPRSIRRKLST